jgi:uncharacterized membrane protein
MDIKETLSLAIGLFSTVMMIIIYIVGIND